MSIAVPLVLASSSPRRQAFLRELGLSFRIVPADIDETPLPEEAPTVLAARLAGSKAQAVAGKLREQGETAVIIAADTVVALGQILLGKPENNADAKHMLTLLRDRAHEVHSAVSVLEMRSQYQRTIINTTTVWMRDYSDAEIGLYVESGDPMDKAGAYAIQHPTFDPAQRISGCLSGVMGLPLGELRHLLEDSGIVLPRSVVEVCEAQTHFPCCQRAEAK